MKKALVVGIDNYQGHYNLSSCINNAKVFDEIIATNEDGTKNFDVKLELDTTSKYSLKKSIIELFGGECETALFYFAGYGMFSEIGGYIVTPDMKLFDEGISIDEILLVANNSRARNKVIILDCSYSGAFSNMQIFENRQTQLGEGVSVIMSKEIFAEDINFRSNRIFSTLLFEALRGGGANMLGHISPTSVYTFIDQALAPWHQRPVFKANILQSNTLRLVRPLIQADMLRKIIEYFPEPDYLFHLNPSFEFTNDPTLEHMYIQPYATRENVITFKQLQKFQSLGLVVPVEEDHMYFAAMQSKSCKLTNLGQVYWTMAKDKLI